MCRITNAIKGLPSIINKAQDRKEIKRHVKAIKFAVISCNATTSAASMPEDK